MKTIFSWKFINESAWPLYVVFAVIIALQITGCASTTQKNAGAFLAKVASMDIQAADVSQATNTPIYSHKESISGLHHSPDSFSVENLKADFAIPLWGVTWNFSASAITGKTPQTVAQVAAAPVSAPSK